MGSKKRYIKKIVSLLIMLTMIVNLIPNFRLLNSISNASDLTSGVILKLDTEKDIWTTSNNYSVVSFDIIAKNMNCTSIYLPLKFDSTKVYPGGYIDGEFNYIMSATNIVDTSEGVSYWSGKDSNISNIKNGKILLDIEGIEGERLEISETQKIGTIHFIIKEGAQINSVSDLSTDIIGVDRQMKDETYRFCIYDADAEEEVGYLDTSMDYEEYINTYLYIDSIEISPIVTSIEIANNPTSGEYIVGDEVDLTNGTLTVNYSKGLPKTINMADATITTGTKEGAFADLENPIKFTYEGKETTLTLENIVDPVKSIKFYDKNNVLVNYKFRDESEADKNDGDSIPKDELYIIATKKSNATEVIRLDDSRITLDSDVADISKVQNPYVNLGEISGIQPVKVTYSDSYVTGLETLFTIMVNDGIGSINVIDVTPLTEYTINNEFVKIGNIEIIGASGHNYGEISMTSDNVVVTETDKSAVKLDKVGEKELLVTLGNATDTYKINVINTVEAIEVNVPEEIVLQYGQALKASDFTGVTITEIMADPSETGNTFDLNFAWVDTSTFDSESAEPQTLTVNYPYNGTTLQGTIDVIVADELFGITIQDFKTKYEYKQDLDYTNATLCLNYLSMDIPLSLEDLVSEGYATVTGYDNTKLGEQILTITYTNEEEAISETTTVKVNVIKAKPKYTVPTGLTATYGATLANVELPSDENGTFSWQESETTLVGDVGTKTHKVKYTPTDLAHYVPVEDIDVDIEVTRKDIEDSYITFTAPTDLKYNGTGKSADVKINLPASLTGAGELTVKYYKEENGVVSTEGSTEAPVNAGKYIVKASVSEGANFNAYAENKVGEFTITKGEPTCADQVATATYGDTLADVTLPTVENGTLSWKEEGTTKVGDVGEQTHKAIYTPTDSANYNSKEINVVITVEKATPQYTPPTGIEGYEGQVLAQLALPTGFTWTDNTINLPRIQENGTTYNTTVTYTPTDSNYKVVENIPVEITVKPDVLTNLRITKEPTKKQYYERQEFDKTGMEVTATYLISGDQVVTDYIVEPSGELTLDTQKVTISYGDKTVDQAITVIPDVITDITVVAPSTLSYNYGDKIDLTGGTITRVWASGKEYEGDTIPMTKDMLSNSSITDFDNMQTSGTKQITVTNFGITKTNAFQITIEDEIDHIEIQDKAKLQTEYVFGETINLKDKNPNLAGTYDNLYIIVKYKGGTEDKRVVITSDMVSGFDMSKVQDGQTVTVKYSENGKDYTDTYTINVKDELVGIDIVTEPTKKIYKLGETASFNDIVVKNTMKSGAEGTALNPSEYTISGFSSTTVGEKIITVKKNGTTYTDTFKIKVIDVTTDMYISKLPKTIYKYGESIDLTNGEIIVKTQANTEGIAISMKDASISVTGYNANKLGDQTLTATYTYKELNEVGIEETKTKTDTFTVKVEDYWAGKIEIIAPDKKQYEYGEDLKLAGGQIGKIMASGAKEAKVAITGEMISGYDKTKVGKQTITVTYFGKTATFDVTVADSVVGISMNTIPNKTEYTKGQELDLTGATLNVTKGFETKVVSITKGMVSGYNPNLTGIQVITVSYEGKTTQFKVNVKGSGVKPTTEPSTKPTTRPTTEPSTNPSEEPSQTEKYTVKFMNYDGTMLKEEIVEKGKPATAPELDERKGYKFVGWNQSFDSVEGDMIVIAIYEEIEKVQVDVGTGIPVDEDGKLDISDLTITIFDDEGNPVDKVPVTEDMISGYNPNSTETQDITITYVDEDGTEYKTTVTVNPKKITGTLGEKDENKEDNNDKKDTKDTIIRATVGVGISGLLLLLIALITKKNVEIYAITEEGKKLIGKEKINKNNKTISLDAYKSSLKDAKDIELVVSDNALEKFEGETIEIILNNQKQRYNITKIIKVNK